MLVQCPNCQTTYKVADEVVKGAGPTFRCSRCKHTFELELSENSTVSHAQSKSESQTAKPTQDEEPGLPFAPTQQSEAPRDEEKDLQIPRPDEVKSKPKPEAKSARGISEERQSPAFISGGADSPREAQTTDAQKDFPATDALFPSVTREDESANNILAISPYLELRASVKPFVTLFSLLVIAFSLFAAMGYAHPETRESLLKKIPLLGPTVLKNNHLKEGILLKSLATASQSIQGNREVFFVTGVAVNQNPAVVREIQLTGKMYNDAGKEIERQTIWVGNTLSPKILRGMTLEDIPQLQDLKPLKSFEIPPGDSVPFTIVFLKSAKNAREFTCQVVLATGEV